MACGACDYHFRGRHAKIARWNRLFKQLFTFDTTTTYADRTACPHCRGWVPLYTGEDGLVCMYCGTGIRTGRVVNITPEEMAVIRPAFGQVLDRTQLDRVGHLLENYDLHPRDRRTFEAWVTEARARLNHVQMARPTPTPAPTGPEKAADVAWFDLIAAHLDDVARGKMRLDDLIRDFLADRTDGGRVPPPDPALYRRLKDPTCGGRIAPWVPPAPWQRSGRGGGS